MVNIDIPRNGKKNLGFLQFQKELFNRIIFDLDVKGRPKTLLNYAQLYQEWIDKRDSLLKRYPINPQKGMIIGFDKLVNNQRSFSEKIFSEGIINLLFPKVLEVDKDNSNSQLLGYEVEYMLMPGIMLLVKRYFLLETKEFLINRIVKTTDMLTKCIYQ
ncbi:hypothetical protein [Pedobacter sp. NJ-S-72]